MRSLKRSKKGAVMFYLAFMFSAIFVVLVASVMAPMGVEINSRFYLEGQRILARANTSIQDINDATVKASVQDAIDGAFNAQANNIEVNANLFQYSWILVIALTAMVIFIFTRRTVEYSGGGFI